MQNIFGFSNMHTVWKYISQSLFSELDKNVGFWMENIWNKMRMGLSLFINNAIWSNTWLLNKIIMKSLRTDDILGAKPRIRHAPKNIIRD